jgi:predicted alpha/beta-fold hydrolase
VQTVLGVLLNDWQRRIACRPQQVLLADGDRLSWYDSRPRQWQPGAPIALLVHGLTGCHRSGYLVRLGRMLLGQGVRVVRMDLRGAGTSLRLARRTYTAASSPDVRAVAEAVLADSPGSPLVLAGFSLGGNIVLKLAGEAAADPLPGLAGVAAVNPPIDLTHCSQLLDQPGNRFYNLRFARKLVEIAVQHRQLFPDLPTVDFPRDLTLRQFDDLYTAPRWGFADAADYYRRASSRPLIRAIRVPLLILTAQDDPFVGVEPIASLPARAGQDVRIARQGGHLGYIGLDGSSGVRWGERQVAEWMLRTMSMIRL